MKSFLALTLALILSTLSVRALDTHERLRVRNDFKSPEDVVRYYCARDASGFVWSGLLDIERRLFTVWKSVPQAESFLIARRYEVVKAPAQKPGSDTVKVEVRYDVVGHSDAQGGFVEAPSRDHRVEFELKKVGAQWKIVSPAPEAISPVVLQSKFQFAANR